MERLSGIDFTAIKGFICDMDGVIVADFMSCHGAALMSCR